MRTTPWKMLAWFLAGLMVMWMTACAVNLGFGAKPTLMNVHWGVWLAATVLLPLFAVAAHLNARGSDAVYLLSYLLNAVGSGCAVGILLSYKAVAVTASLLLALLAPATLALAMCLLLWLIDWPRFFAITFTVLGIVMVFAGFVAWEAWESLLGCGMVFGGLFFLSFPVACGKALGKPWGSSRYLSFSGFGVYLTVLAVVILMMAEDGIDGLFEALFDGIDVGDGPRKKKKKNL